jgi:hypothetical protein
MGAEGEAARAKRERRDSVTPGIRQLTVLGEESETPENGA